MGDVIKGIGKVVGSAAPVLGMIPGVGTIPAAIAGGVGGLASGKGLGGALRGAASGALGGLGGGLLEKATGGAAGRGLSGLAGQIGGALKGTYAPGGQLDLGKVLGTVGGVSQMIGQGKQRRSAQDYANAQIAQRNALMSKILAPQDYGLPQPNLNQQSSATSGGY